jgi:hypothetical protein
MSTLSFRTSALCFLRLLNACYSLMFFYELFPLFKKKVAIKLHQISSGLCSNEMRAHRLQYFLHTQTLCPFTPSVNFHSVLSCTSLFYLFSLLSLGLPIVFYLLDECLESIPELHSNEVEGNIYTGKEEV